MNGGLGGVFVKFRAVTDDQQTDLSLRNLRGCFPRLPEQHLSHGGVAADRITILENLAIAGGDGTLQLEFAGDDRADEVSLADKIRNDVDLGCGDGMKNLPHRGLLFPETTMNLVKDSPLTD